MENTQLSEFGVILLFIVGGLLFCILLLTIAKFLRLSKPNAEKLSSYECGEDAEGSPWAQLNVRFYVIAIIFILFEVEIVFLFPWATVFGQKHLIDGTGGLWAWFSIAEAFIFIAILILGLAYVWAKGYLDWVKPEQKTSHVGFKVPEKYYNDINEKYKSAAK